ncbi:hypothetical protein JKP88DRAFT_203024 [Tribonema minus]|uniref:Uncharacterized protein n=1 Tax=Tribonema minus TaxID=303371 RepID=A0A836C8Z1_9STRA|nr:hypothetical protein JKP88DRAFT_203024 [Tribonema minus]
MEQGVRGSPYTILVCGTDPRERKKTRRALAARFREQAVVGEQPLTVSELKGIKLRGPKTDLALLVHFSEGRVLLTDKDGLYNDFLLEAVKLAGGNLLIAVSGVETAPGTLAHEGVVQALAYSGGQRAVLSIHQQKRFLTWAKEPAPVHLDHIAAALAGNVRLLAVPDSVNMYSSALRRRFCQIL